MLLKYFYLVRIKIFKIVYYITLHYIYFFLKLLSYFDSLRNEKMSKNGCELNEKKDINIFLYYKKYFINVYFSLCPNNL